MIHKDCLSLDEIFLFISTNNVMLLKRELGHRFFFLVYDRIVLHFVENSTNLTIVSGGVRVIRRIS